MNSLIRSLGLMLPIVFAHTAVLAETVARTSAFVYDSDGVLIREVIEPTDSALCVATQYTLDVYGNRSATQTRNCNGSTIAGVGTEAAAPPAPPVIPNASGDYTQFASRTVSTYYGAIPANPVAGQFPTRNTNAIGHSENQEFDLRFGTIKKLTGPNGINTTWSYDSFGRKAVETRADGSYTYWEYVFCANAAAGACPSNIQGALPYYYIRSGDLSSSHAQIGPVNRTYFDSLNRPIRTQAQIVTGPTAWTWRTQDTVYDAWGRVARVSNPYLSDITGHIAQQTAQWTYNSYDILGRLIKEETEDPAASDTANRINGRYVRTVSYNGLSSTSTNTKGQITTRVNNVVGQLFSVTDAQNNTITHSYDALGNQIQTNASGVITNVSYDLRGRKTSMSDPHMGVWQYRYNALGELRLQQSGKGQFTTITYDALGRQTERREADLISTWTYDTHSTVCAAAPNTAKGKPTRATTSTGYERIHCYDSLGREVSERVTMDGNVFWSGTVYETGTGRIAQQVYPARVQPNIAPTTNAAPASGISANYSVRNEYSAVGLIRQRNHINSALLWQIHSLTASATDQIARTTLGNNLVETSQADPWGRIKTNALGTNTTTADRLSEGYSFDSESNLSARSWMDFGAPVSAAAPVARAENFTYDSLNRLTNTSGTTGVPSKAVSYNQYGNILTKDARTYTYSNTAKPHQLTQIAGSIHGASNPGYTYDANGNMLTGGGATISWMSFNMVDTLTQGSQISSFRYGPEHQRVRQVAAYNGQSITTWYIENFELEKNASTNTTQAKYYIAGKILHIEEGTGATPSKVETKYLHKDHLGSVVLITSQTGAALERYSYDAWGKRRNLDGTDYTANGGHLLGATDRGYTGHEHLDHLGLVHMNGRIYDASLGRFMSADPIIAQTANLQNYNRYAYVNNNPLSYTDPSGFFIKKLFKNKVFRVAVGIGLAYWGAGAFADFLINNQIGWLTKFSGVFSDGWMLTTAGKAAVGAAGGFAGALGASGGDFKAAMNGGVSGALFGFAGTVGVASNSIERYFAHAAAGCISSAIGGADCDQGASAALAGKLVTNNTPQSMGGPEGFVAASVAGGTASVVTGGKFGNGAYTAAYGYLYNHAFAYLAAGTVAAAKVAARIFRGKLDDAAEGAVDLAKKPINRDKLNKQLGSQQQLDEVGVPIAGRGTSESLKDSRRLVDEYGGNPADWSKRSSSQHTTSDGRKFETHWYENSSTGQRVEPKTIVQDYLKR